MTRVAVTTDRFDDVADVFREAGLEPVALPCIRVVASPPHELTEIREVAGTADLLMVTSPRVVSLLWPHGRMPDVDTAVVGSTTAQAVVAAGGNVTVVGDAGLARLADLALGSTRDRRVVLAHAAGSDPAGLARVQESAAELIDRVVYESVPVAPDLIPVDAVAFASPSAVAGWTLARDLDGLIVGTIGTTTARAIERHRSPDVIAATPSYPALAEAIATFMEVRV